MSIQLKLSWPGKTIVTLYTTPQFSCEGPLAIWKQRSKHYRTGFVARFLWLGFIFRYGKPDPMAYYSDLDIGEPGWD